MNGSETIPFSRWVRLILGALLMVAAILKLLQGQSVNPVRLVRLGQDSLPWLEILLSFWLISGIGRVWSLVAAVVVFFSFSVTTLRMVFQGVTDCGCFGILSLSPKLTYWIDVLALIAGVIALCPKRSRTLIPAILLPALALYLGTLTGTHYKNPSPAIEVGHSWPIAGDIDCSADLSKGRWVALIYSSDCARCQSLATSYTEEAAEWAALGKNGKHWKETRLALLDVDAAGELGTVSPTSGVARGELLQANLYHHTPILLLLDRGKVLAIHEGWEVADWSYPPFSSWLR